MIIMRNRRHGAGNDVADIVFKVCVMAVIIVFACIAAMLWNLPK